MDREDCHADCDYANHILIRSQIAYEVTFKIPLPFVIALISDQKLFIILDDFICRL